MGGTLSRRLACKSHVGGFPRRTVNPQDTETTFPAPASCSPASMSGTRRSSQAEGPAPHSLSAPGEQSRLREDQRHSHRQNSAGPRVAPHEGLLLFAQESDEE